MRSPSTVPVTLTVKDVGIAFDVTQGLAGPAFFALGVRKSGSSMFNQMLTFLARHNGVNTVGLPDRFFMLGLRARDWADLDLTPVLQPGNLYAGFRTLPPSLPGTAAFRTGRKVFLFRDPRVALVSQYFSDAYSHGLPDAAAPFGPVRPRLAMGGRRSRPSGRRPCRPLSTIMCWNRPARCGGPWRSMPAC